MQAWLKEILRYEEVAYASTLDEWLDEGDNSKGTLPKLNEGSKYLLVDGDILAFKASAATDGRCYTVVSSGAYAETHTFKYKREALGWCANNDEDIKRIQLSYTPEPIAHALNLLKKQMKTLEQLCTKEYGGNITTQVFLTGKKNFRNNIEPNYKSSRQDKRRPYHLSACKEYMVKHMGATYTDGYEADDLLSITAKELGYNDVIVASIDKDLLQIPCIHLNIDKETFTTISDEEGRHLFWKQVLTGDKVDDIKGLFGIGAAKSEKLLKDTYGGSDVDYYKSVLQIYLDQVSKEEGESEGLYLTRVIKRVTVAASLLYLCQEYGEVWSIPTTVTNDTKKVR